MTSGHLTAMKDYPKIKKLVQNTQTQSASKVKRTDTNNLTQHFSTLVTSRYVGMAHWGILGVKPTLWQVAMVEKH